MKKTIVLFFFLFILMPASVFAVDYEINDTEITAVLKTDGGVEVKETHEYSFDGEFNGITRTLIPKENTSISNVRASENGTNLDIEQEDELYKVHRSGSDETVSIDLFYTIENGLNVYEDVADFYWPFFDDSNESTYENMSITIEPPEAAEVKAAYGEHEAYNTERIQEDGRVTFELGEVPSGEKGNVRVVYDAGLFQGVPLTSETQMLNEIQAEEQALRDQVMAREAQQDRWGGLAPFITGSLAAAALLLIVHGYRKRQEVLREAERQSSGGGRFPKESMSLPAMIAFMKHGQLSTSALTAALLDLVRKGNIEEVSEKEFKLIHRNTEYEHESILIHWLFDEIGHDGEFHVEEMEAYVKDEDNHESYQSQYNTWCAAVKKEYKQYDLYVTSGKPRWISGIAALMTLPFVILFPYYGFFMWMAAAIGLLIFFLFFAIAYQPLTVEGHRIKKDLQPLTQGEEWKAWDKEDQVPALLYQIGSGNWDLLTKNTPALSSASNDWMIFIILGAALHNSFDSAEQHTAVTASTGVGAGGGGTGVGGGGGGSGAF
nr:DUF2207 domain-containing protein [Halobacillus sp. A5]